MKKSLTKPYLKKYVKVVLIAGLSFLVVALVLSRDVVYLNMTTADLQRNVELFDGVLMACAEPFDVHVVPAHFTRSQADWKCLETRPLLFAMLSKMTGWSSGPSGCLMYRLEQLKKSDLDDPIKLQIRDAFLRKTASEGMLAGTRYLQYATSEAQEKRMMGTCRGHAENDK